MKKGLKLSEAWRAILNRDGRYDGAFVYAVKTTGIYCRPTCPSRRPRPENVTLFETIVAAEQAGFRACRRCRPSSLAAVDVCVDAARKYIDAHLDERVTLSKLSAITGLSASHLQRVFASRVGLSPMAYAKARRIDRFKQSARKQSTVSEALYEAGFGSSRGLYEQGGATLGMSPARYKRGGEGLVIRYITGSSVLGRVLVAVTDRGVCAVFLGDTTAAVENQLQTEFFSATLQRDRSLAKELSTVVGCFSGSIKDIVLDLRGTNLQLQVWTALQAIPAGETRTYAELAKAVGQPGAVRAVASACAKNRLAVLVPCHRAVRRDGAPSGYRWGLARKEKLLDDERAQRPRDK